VETELGFLPMEGPLVLSDEELPGGERCRGCWPRQRKRERRRHQVMLFADRLELWNPGELPPSIMT